MERNWLIRTSQNQILGPVAKAKLLEFIQKGALGMTDEVTSGNGYWFSLKEKDLVEKYIFGDIPQGYNPISESKSVLARRDNPDKTSSINNAPANKTQVIKMSDLGPGLAPKSQDLEFPDITAPVPSTLPVLNFDEPDTAPVVSKSPAVNLYESEGLKLPTNDDLEFPDVGAIAANVNQSFQYPGPGQSQSANMSVNLGGHSPKIEKKVEVHTSGEEIVLPNDDDLAFPDMGSFEEKTSTKVEKGHVDLDHQYTRTVALDTEQAAKVLPEIADDKDDLDTRPPRDLDRDFGEKSLSLDKHSKGAAKDDPTPIQRKERLQQPPQNNNEDKKLLHERKTKSSSKPAAKRDPSREVAHKDDQSEPLKKRNDNYIFFILIILILIIVAVFFYFKEILNKPLPV